MPWRSRLSSTSFRPGCRDHPLDVFVLTEPELEHGRPPSRSRAGTWLPAARSDAGRRRRQTRRRPVRGRAPPAAGPDGFVRRHRAGSRRSGRTVARSGVSKSPSTNEIRSATPCRIAFRRATSRAAAEISVAVTRAFDRSCAIATARQPHPVPTSATTMRGLETGSSSSAASTMISVSARGISTAGVTSKSRPQNSLDAEM